jgi:hypothetical protein
MRKTHCSLQQPSSRKIAAPHVKQRASQTAERVRLLAASDAPHAKQRASQTAERARLRAANDARHAKPIEANVARPVR